MYHLLLTQAEQKSLAQEQLLALQVGVEPPKDVGPQPPNNVDLQPPKQVVPQQRKKRARKPAGERKQYRLPKFDCKCLMILIKY